MNAIPLDVGLWVRACTRRMPLWTLTDMHEAGMIVCI